MTTTLTESHHRSDPDAQLLDVLIIGGGFSGIYELDRLRDLGFSVKVWDAAGDFGGIWWWNNYPGAKTDTIGGIYQFSYKELWKEYNFSKLYLERQHIRDYFEYVNSKLDLRKDIEFNTFAESCEWDEENLRWHARSSDGKETLAKTVILATGFGSKPLYPSIDGLEDFAGQCHHTARWPQEGLDMTGKRVVILGTGASAVGVIEQASEVAAQVTVFQRTPNMALPMRQRTLSAEDNERIREGLPERFRIRRDEAFAGFDFNFIPQNTTDVSADERDETYERMWGEGGFPLWLGLYQDVIMDETANRTFYDFWRSKIHERVKDPEVAELLAPVTPPHPYGTKRPTLENTYYDCFNQENVKLIDSNVEPIERVVPEGVVTSKGLVECDVLVLATGYDNNRGGIMAIDIRGAEGLKLQEKWESYVHTFMGLTTAGFPNMFFLYGPQSPAGFCNGPTSAEYQGEMVARFLEHVRETGAERYESTVEAEQEWTAHVDELFNASLFPKAKSWYWGANVPGKPAQMLNYPGGVPVYFDRLDEEAAQGYPAFEIK